MVDVFTNTIFYHGERIDAMQFYTDRFLPTKQQLIDRWYQEQQDLVNREVEAQLTNNAIAKLAHYQLGR